MLSSIHPLGERGRNNRWAITVSAFTFGSVLTGASVGGALGYLGELTISGLTEGPALALTGAAAVAAGLLDLMRFEPPGPERQVNEHWIGHYRGWVYGGAFGAQLGLGVLTYVVTWGVYATLLAEILTGSPVLGALVGAVFGIGRSITVIVAGWVRRPSQLTSFHRQIARIGPSVRTVSAGLVGVAGVIAVVGVAL